MDKKVSVIIPVYNVEKYLAQCVDSVLSQDYKNLEVILVDDGSKDSCGAMCDDYKSKDDRVVVVHKANGGLSSARNAGTAVATGDYVAYVDSDDWVSEDYVSYLLGLAEKHGADIVSARLQTVWDNNSPEAIDYSSEEVYVFDRKSALAEMLYGYKIMVTACKLFRTDIAKDHPFPEGVLYEDLGVMYKFFNDSDKIVSSNLPMYYYRRRSGSIMNEKFDKRHLVILEHANNQYEFIKSNYPELVTAAGYRCAFSVTKLAPMVVDAKDKETFKILQNELKDHYQQLSKNPKAYRKIKVRGFMIKHGYGLSCVYFKTEKFLKKLMGKNMYN